MSLLQRRLSVATALSGALLLGLGSAAASAAVPVGPAAASINAMAPAVASSTAGTTTVEDGGPKPFAPGTIVIDPASIVPGSPDVAVTAVPNAELSRPTVTLTATGGASVSSGAVAVTADTESTVDVGAAAPRSAGTITATLTGRTASGALRSISDTVWLDTVAGTVIVSDTGTQDLELKTIAQRLAVGLISEAEAAAATRQAKGGTASTTVAALDAACAGVCITGTVRWTDSIGQTHPVRRAPVQILDFNSVTDDIVTTVTTDDTGSYTATVDNVDGEDGTGRDIFVRVLAAGATFEIVDQYIDSGVSTDVPTGTELTTDLTANNVADNNTAFSLQNAMQIADEYLVGVHGSSFPFVPVLFPSPGGGSFYDGTSLQVDGLDRWDWDVMLHEYGHYLADQMNIEDNPGGTHSSTDNLSDTRGSKTIGIPLAYGEAWPTYFAVSSLKEMGTASLNIPNIGDDEYQDTEDQVITNNLETGSNDGEGNGTVGEDNELTGMCILWDLYDSSVDGLDTVALGTNHIWDLLDANDRTTLSATYPLFATGDSSTANDVNGIFTQYNVSPRITGPVTQAAPASSPTITWSRGNGGTHQNNSFVVEYRNAATNALLFASPAVAGTSYTAPAASWTAARAGAVGAVNVSVIGTQTDTPVTGPYRSALAAFTVPAQTAPVFTASTPPATGTVGTPYAYTYVASGNPAPTFVVASGALPAGLSLNAATGVLSGTPTTAGPATFTVRATNGVGVPAVTACTTVTIAPIYTGTAPTIAGTPGGGSSGTAYSFQFTVTGSPAPSVTVSAGALPAGLSLTTAGKLAGTPTTAGSYTFTVRASNTVGAATRTVTVVITAGAAKNLVVAAGHNQTVEINKAFANLQAKVTDLAGNAKAGVVVTFTVTTGPAKFPAAATTVTATTGANGIATAAVLTAGSTAGAVVVTATAAGTTTATFNLTVKNTPTADLAVTLAGPTSAANNTTFTQTIKVKNNGPSAATTTVTTLAVPNGATIVSAAGGRTIKIDNRYFLVWSTPSVAVGATVTYAPTFKIGPTVHSTVCFAVVTGSLVKDPKLSNNAAAKGIRLG